MTVSAMDRVRKNKLRPLSSATALTDITYSTIEADSDPQSDDVLEESETQSLTPSVFEYQKKYGRTYHGYKAGSYPFPNDRPELERLDMQHAILKALFHNKNYFAPLKPKKPKRMMDIGCGTGIWCCEMASEFPKCRVEGIDLSPIQPERAPENIDWYVDDILADRWWRMLQPFNYIHTRMSAGIFTDFREIIQKSYNNLEPGGWMESQELYPKLHCDDHSMPPDYPLLEWQNTVDKAAMGFGKPIRIANKLKKWYEQAGFVDVHEETFPIPVNAWPRDDRLKLLGKFFGWNLEDGIQGWSLEFFVSGLGWSPAEVEVFLAHVRDSIKDKSVHAYYKVYVVWGRKPRADEPQSTVPKPDTWPQPPPHIL